MKLIVVLAGVFALCSGDAIPTVPGDNSHYVEGESRYIWMPDDEESPQLVDLQEPVDGDQLKLKVGAYNQYWLYTRKNPNAKQVIIYGNANTIQSSNYVASRPLMVIVHGWYNRGDTRMYPLIKSAVLDVQDANVIIVDWSSFSFAGYTTAVAGVASVGRFLGNFLTWLLKTTEGNWNNVHLVGFSLGAHIVGVAGRTVGGRPARITGLDPAGPCWTNNSNALNRKSGQYVEVIHTDGGMLGLFKSMADADFYPNKGKHPQPGCWYSSICSHGRASELYASSVRTNHFVGRSCSKNSTLKGYSYNNCTGAILNMGNAIINKRGAGIFGLQTGSSWPY